MTRSTFLLMLLALPLSASRAAAAAAASRCAVCGKTAYAVESITFKKVVYHKRCFTCSNCKTLLHPNTAVQRGTKLYCTVHAPKVTNSPD
jgi:flavoprotein